MPDSYLTVYNQRHHNCTSVGELHGLADAMRQELLARISACERANERILELDRMVGEADKDIDDLEASLEQCEAQKRGLATAAKTGMAAGNRVVELQAVLARLKGYIRMALDELSIPAETYPANLANAVNLLNECTDTDERTSR